ncbi:MAG: TIGR00153 family protein [Methanosarcinaceae archaeon]|nr:TIGR00153 family protein [Methanosarcinaceae archaeon]MDD4748996.1 TIGR00153 family protein [Methanosarcinaceae archaeon]
MRFKNFVQILLRPIFSFPQLPFKEHAEKGVLAAQKLQEAVEAYCVEDMKKVELRSTEIDLLETRADALKQELRKNLPSSFVLPLDPKAVLVFINQQDAIPNVAQSAAYWMSLRPATLPENIKRGFLRLATTVLETVKVYSTLISGFYSFLKMPHKKENVRQTLALVSQVEKLEHEVDLIESELLKKIFANEQTFGGAGVCHLTDLVEKIGEVADRAAIAADSLRAMLLRR